MFYLDQKGIYRVRALDQFAWLEYGFGTRHSPEFGHGANVATLHQIHSDVVVDAAGRSGNLGDGDALVENVPGRMVAVKTADCVPILLVDARRRAVAAIHAGWRGSAAKIIERAAQGMKDRFGTDPADLHAAIGPAIGVCCYEVGPEVSGQFGARPDEAAGQAHLDLPAINQGQLAGLGVPPAQIYLAGLCTKCLERDFYSWRREGKSAGRMLSAAGLR